MKKKVGVLIALAGLLVGAIAFAAAEPKVDLVNSPWPQWFVNGIYVGPLSVNPVSSTGNKITRYLGGSATIDFAAATVGKIDSSGITVTGAKLGDPCYVGVPAAAGAQKSDFSCYVSAADTVKVVFSPMDQISGSVALASASPSTAVVALGGSGYTCSCYPVGTTAAIAAGGCAASVTTTNLTVTGPNTVTTTVKYDCNQAVDPASGTYFVRVVSSQ